MQQLQLEEFNQLLNNFWTAYATKNDKGDAVINEPIWAITRNIREQSTETQKLYLEHLANVVASKSVSEENKNALLQSICWQFDYPDFFKETDTIDQIFKTLTETLQKNGIAPGFTLKARSVTLEKSSIAAPISKQMPKSTPATAATLSKQMPKSVPTMVQQQTLQKSIAMTIAKDFKQTLAHGMLNKNIAMLNRLKTNAGTISSSQNMVSDLASLLKNSSTALEATSNGFFSLLDSGHLTDEIEKKTRNAVAEFTREVAKILASSEVTNCLRNLDQTDTKAITCFSSLTIYRETSNQALGVTHVKSSASVLVNINNAAKKTPSKATVTQALEAHITAAKYTSHAADYLTKYSPAVNNSNVMNLLDELFAEQESLRELFTRPEITPHIDTAKQQKLQFVTCQSNEASATLRGRRKDKNVPTTKLEKKVAKLAENITQDKSMPQEYKDAVLAFVDVLYKFKHIEDKIKTKFLTVSEQAIAAQLYIQAFSMSKIGYDLIWEKCHQNPASARKEFNNQDDNQFLGIADAVVFDIILPIKKLIDKNKLDALPQEELQSAYKALDDSMSSAVGFVYLCAKDETTAQEASNLSELVRYARDKNPNTAATAKKYIELLRKENPAASEHLAKIKI